jgi:GGDEF domain-containing protein
MKAQQTARKAHVTERQKAWARLALLTVVGLVCPPLAAARSAAVWGTYLLLAVLYSLWTVRVSRTVTRDRLLGYLLCLTDAVVLVPLMVWSVGPAMRAVLALLWVTGAMTSWRAAVARAQASKSKSHSRRSVSASQSGPHIERSRPATVEAPLERALRVRLRVLEGERTRFAVVLLRVAGHQEMIAEYGEEATKEVLREVGRRGLRLLGQDAQLFTLPGGRMAFLFDTDLAREPGRSSDRSATNQIDAYDVESLAMTLAKRACEQAVGGRPLECVVGWASAPADGTTADDLMYAAESGALSGAAFRRVGGPHVPVPEAEKKRAVAV